MEFYKKRTPLKSGKSKIKKNGSIRRKRSWIFPAYVRDNLTDDLHDIFNFRPVYEITTYEDFKNIFYKVKRKG